MTHLRDAGIDLAIAGMGFTLYNLVKEVLGFFILLATAILVGYRLWRAIRTHFASEQDRKD